MKKEWLKYVCDPIDKTSLRASGETLVSRSGNVYKIKDGIPILLTKDTQSTGSVESFGYEWNEFDYDYAEDGWWKDIIKPIWRSANFFKDKVIVDCGAGSGRQSYWMAKVGAKFIFSLELSSAVHTIVRRVVKPYGDKIFAIQADIAHMPINVKNVRIDLIYCVNVIQHTKSPGDTLLELAGLMNRNTYLLFNIYLTRDRETSLKILGLLRTVTRKFPKSILRYFCFFMTLVFYPLSQIKILEKIIRKLVPISHSFKETWLDTYDLLGSHTYQKFYTEHELQTMLKNARLTVVKRSKYALLLKKT